jgi:5-methylcytosine-specific restriction endonuclease McrA
MAATNISATNMAALILEIPNIYQQLHENLLAKVKTERKITLEILGLISEAERLKVFRDMGYSTMHVYLTQGLGYSAAAASRRLAASKVYAQHPEISESVKSGDLNISQMASAHSAFGQAAKENAPISHNEQKEILESLAQKTSFESEKILQTRIPSYEKPIPKITPKKDKVVVQMEFTYEEYQQVEALVAEYSHKAGSTKLEEVIKYFARKTVQKRERTTAAEINAAKVTAAKIQEKIKEKITAKVTATMNSESVADESSKNTLPENLSPKNAPPHEADTQVLPLRKKVRSHIPANVQRIIFKNANHACQFVSRISGKKCCETKFLEIDHLVPVAKGGGDNIENLRVLCRAHNSLASEMHGFFRGRNW